MKKPNNFNHIFKNVTLLFLHNTVTVAFVNCAYSVTSTTKYVSLIVLTIFHFNIDLILKSQKKQTNI